MKTAFRLHIVLGIVFLYSINCYSQEYLDKNKLDKGKIESYNMQVTHNKTSHLLFPATIRYVDLGSEYIIADKAEETGNVLRIKASKKDFEEETNFSVITNDGRFYNFNVMYDPKPNSLSYDLLTMQKSNEREQSSEVMFNELGNSLASLADLLMESIYKKNKRVVKHIGAKSFGIHFLLKGIYIHNDQFFFHTEVRNLTNVPFNIDFINFKVVDRRLAKRTVVQERSLNPLRRYTPVNVVYGKSVEQNVFLLDQFTIANDKELHIEIFEKNGGRHQVLRIDNVDLINAMQIKNMHLKIQ